MRLVLSFLLLAGLITPVGAQESVPFAKGADVGWLSEMESKGVTFSDENGQTGDLLQILKNEGINSIRLRVWVNPKDGWCGKDDVVKMAKRASALDFRIMIDFHYSDSWADPGHQPMPAGWKDHDFTQLQKDVYEHTFNVISALKAAGVTPEWVQVGNEITSGMMWPDGKSSDMTKLVALINQGYNAVKAVDPAIKVVIHLNNGADNGVYRKWFDAALKDGVHFDVIGMSFYPEIKDWTFMSDRCIENMHKLVAAYGKPVMICEIGFYEKETEITQKLLVKMIKGTESVPDHMGLGIFYWEPEGYTEHYNRCAWQPDGRPSPAMAAFSTP